MKDYRLAVGHSLYKGGDMMVTYSDLIQFTVLIVEIVTICFIVFSDKN